MPPPDLTEHAYGDGAALFRPAPEIVAWARACFIGEDASLRNPDHDHLQSARIGALWTNARAGATEALVAAAGKRPEVGVAVIAGICGTCGRAAA